MEESITSDLTDVGNSSGPGSCDIGASDHSSTYPRRIVPDDDSNTAPEDEDNTEDFDNFDEEEDSRRDDDDYNPDSANSRRKSSRLRDKVKEQIPLELRRDHMTVIRVFSPRFQRFGFVLSACGYGSEFIERSLNVFQVEEVAEEELRLQQQSRVKCQLNRETRSNAKGDTKVQFFHTFRGGRYEGNNCTFP